MEYAEDAFRELFEKTQQPTILTAEDGRFVDANQACVDLFGLDNKAKAVGLTPMDVSPEVQPNGRSSAEMAAEYIRTAFETGSCAFEWECVRVNGEHFPVDALITTVELGGKPYIHAVFRDITSRKLAERALAESEDRFRKLFEMTRQAVILVEYGHFVQANQASLDLFGMDKEVQLLGLTPLDVSPPHQPNGLSSAEMATEMTREAMESGSSQFEWECIRTNGTHFFVKVMLTAVSLKDKQIIHAVFDDVTEGRMARNRLEYLAFHDDVTGLPNRRAGQEQLAAAVRRCEQTQTQLAVLFISLNNFQYIDNVHGHEVSSHLMARFGEKLQTCLRSGDSLYRMTNAEFMILLPEVEKINQVINACTKILGIADAPFVLDQIQVSTPASVGVALFPQDGVNGEALTRHASSAMNEARNDRQHAYCFFRAEMDAKRVHYVQTYDALLMAIKRQEFVVHYQPVIDLASGKTVSAEALVRWNHPERGLLPPGEFMGVAEESGLIVPITKWILGEVCHQLMTWRASGRDDLTVAVNLSAVHFVHGTVESDVGAALQASGLPPSCLGLELTESILMNDEDDVLPILRRWRQQGIKLLLDDFGTGYSSLSYLTRFEVDKLKVDRSFITQLQRGSKEESILKAVVQLAHALGLMTVVEGVETQELADFVKELGCNQVQGFFFSKPLSTEDFWERGWA